MSFLKKIFTLIFTITAFYGFSQTDEKLNQEVEVIREYTPTISDAFKLNELPVIKDSARIEPAFLYSIESKQIPTEFQTEPVKPAKMIDEPLSKLYNSYIKLGFGNYLSPLAELYISNLRSKKYTWSAMLRHHSSFGTIINDKNKKVYAGYADNSFNISGKKYISKKSLYGNIDYKDNAFYYYGYNTSDSSLLANFPSDKTGMKNKKHTQQFTKFSLNGGIKTFHTDKSHLNYDIFGSYYYFQDKFQKSENFGSISANLNQYYNKELLGADLMLNMTQKSFNDTSNILVKINPWVSRITNVWEVHIGLAVYADVYWKEDYHFYPDIILQYAVVDKYIVPYMGLTGFVEENTYCKLAKENPFIKPGLDIRNTNHRKVLFGGIKGSINSNTFYNIKATLSDLENTYLFVNDTTKNDQNLRLENQFVLTATDATLLNVYGEVSVKASEKLSFHLKGNYYYYDNMESEKKAWHIPEFDVALTSSYNLQNKIILSADIFGIGDRFAKTYEFTTTGTNEISKKLKPIIDGNLHVEYRYNKNLSGFLHVNNIANQKYYRWNNYRMQGLNFMIGLTYSF